jgi:hypothetical protein
MPRSLQYDEPYLLDERAASTGQAFGRWGIERSSVMPRLMLLRAKPVAIGCGDAATLRESLIGGKQPAASLVQQWRH